MRPARLPRKLLNLAIEVFKPVGEIALAVDDFLASPFHLFRQTARLRLVRGKPVDLFLNPGLLFDKLFGFIRGPLDAFIQSGLLTARQFPGGVIQLLQSPGALGVRFTLTAALGAVERLFHLVNRLLQLVAGFAQLRIAAFARKLLQLPPQLFRLLHQLLLALTSGARRIRRGSSSLGHPLAAFIELLLSLRQLFQSLKRFVDLLIAFLPLSALDCFVLVFEFVHFKLEQIGQVLGIRPGGLRAAAGALRKRDLYFAEKAFRPHELLQRFLLLRQGLIRFLRSKIRCGFPHFNDGVL